MSWYDRILDRIRGPSEPEEREREELDKPAPVSGGGVSRGEPRSEEISRVAPEQLEKYYYFEPLAYAGVNFYAHHVTGEDYKIVGSNDNDVHRVRSFLEESNYRSKLENIMRDLGIFGNSFGELVWNKKGDEVVDLAMLDPKEMEYLKVRSKKGEVGIAVDSLGRPVGYIQKKKGLLGQKDEGTYREIVSKTKGVTMDQMEVEKGVPFHRDEIVHFKLQNLSNTLMGVGLIEPVFDTITLKIDAEELLQDGMKKAFVSDLVGKVGTFDEMESVSSKDIKDMRKNLEKMRKQDFGVISVPDYWDVEQLESDPGGLRDYFRMFQDLIIVGMGLPPGLLSRGESVGSGIAEIQHALSERVMQSFQSSITRCTRQQIFRILLDKDRVSEVPDMIWKEKNPLTKGKKSRRMSELARAGLLTRDRDLEDHLRDLENLPSLPEETEEEQEEREKKGKKQAERASRGQTRRKTNL